MLRLKPKLNSQDGSDGTVVRKIWFWIRRSDSGSEVATGSEHINSKILQAE